MVFSSNVERVSESPTMLRHHKSIPCRENLLYEKPMVPKRRFCTSKQSVACAFLSTFQGCESSFWATTDWKLYAPQTKILEGRENIRERIFKALFTYVSTNFGLRSFEKWFENTFPNVWAAFQNLRSGSINLFKKSYATLCSTLENSSFGDHKVLTKGLTHTCFDVPKSSFWES